MTPYSDDATNLTKTTSLITNLSLLHSILTQALVFSDTHALFYKKCSYYTFLKFLAHFRKTFLHDFLEILYTFTSFLQTKACREPQFLPNECYKKIAQMQLTTFIIITLKGEILKITLTGENIHPFFYSIFTFKGEI